MSTLTDYQDWTETTALSQTTSNTDGVSRADAVSFLALGLVGETGELAEKIKRSRRSDEIDDEFTELVIDEIGDVLWYATRMVAELDAEIEQLKQKELFDVTADSVEHIVKTLANPVGDISRTTVGLETQGPDDIDELAEVTLLASLTQVIHTLDALATEVGSSIETIAASNMDKLSERKSDGTIHGSGDKR